MNEELLKRMPKGVLPFSYAGIDIAELDKQQLMDLLAWVLHERGGFTFEYKENLQK